METSEDQCGFLSINDISLKIDGGIKKSGNLGHSTTCSNSSENKVL